MLTDLEKFVFVDIETTNLEETSGIYQVSVVIADSRFRVQKVINDFFMVDRDDWDNGYRIPFGYDELERKSNLKSLKDSWEDYHELFWDKGSLVISYNTSFDLRMFSAYSKRNDLTKPNWGTEIYNLDNFKDRANFCAMKAAGRHSGFGHNLKLEQAVKQFTPSVYENKEEGFKRFCSDNGVVSSAKYHDGLFDTWSLYCLMKGNRSWMF